MVLIPSRLADTPGSQVPFLLVTQFTVMEEPVPLWLL